MAPNNKRREATRRQLEQQLHERQEREARRKRAVLIGSVVSTVVVIALVVVLIAVIAHNHGGSKKPQAGSKPTTTPTSSPPTSPSASTPPTDTPCKVTHPAGSVLFDNVTVANPTNLAKTPNVTSCSKQVPKTFAYKDLVVGKGAKATTKSTVSVQYEGIFYSDGYQFNSSWRDNAGKPASFPLTPGGVIDGFSLGIAGSAKIPPMRVGGRRVLVLPSSLAYKAKGNQGIPPNTPLVFVVDLKSVK